MAGKSDEGRWTNILRELRDGFVAYTGRFPGTVGVGCRTDGGRSGSKEKFLEAFGGQPIPSVGLPFEVHPEGFAMQEREEIQTVFYFVCLHTGAFYCYGHMYEECNRYRACSRQTWA